MVAARVQAEAAQEEATQTAKGAQVQRDLDMVHVSRGVKATRIACDRS